MVLLIFRLTEKKEVSDAALVVDSQDETKTKSKKNIYDEWDSNPEEYYWEISLIHYGCVNNNDICPKLSTIVYNFLKEWTTVQALVFSYSLERDKHNADRSIYGDHWDLNLGQ